VLPSPADDLHVLPRHRLPLQRHREPFGGGTFPVRVDRAHEVEVRRHSANRTARRIGGHRLDSERRSCVRASRRGSCRRRQAAHPSVSRSSSDTAHPRSSAKRSASARASSMSDSG
jgi:hypothetical protein